ncbi:uncharacterized protein TNCV_1226201 [Trichonephila clavipes]|nr:uncharacterized protein TNCV_1226201 [Trichonephila clavipes]
MEAHEIHRGKGLDVCLTLAVALNIMQVTGYVLDQFHPNFEGEYLGGGQRPPTSLLLPPTSRGDLRLHGYLKYPHTTKALFIYKHPWLLRDSNPGPTAQQSASLATIPDGRHLSIYYEGMLQTERAVKFNRYPKFIRQIVMKLSFCDLM